MERQTCATRMEPRARGTTGPGPGPWLPTPSPNQTNPPAADGAHLDFLDFLDLIAGSGLLMRLPAGSSTAPR